MGDLSSKKLIVLKGLLFLGIALICAMLIWMQSPSWKILILLVLLVWAACRFYYFLFYVLEKYVYSNLRYAGLLALIQAILTRKK